MKKRSNLIIIILLIMSIIAFLSTYYFLYVKTDKEEEIKKNLSGEKITDGLYLYNLDIDDDHNYAVKVYNNNIYYWIELEDKYEFYKVDIYTNEKEKIGSFDLKDSYCYFEKDFIDCSTNDRSILYDFNFKKIYDGEHKTIFPYKDDFIMLENNTIYFKNKEYKKVKKDLTTLNVYDHDSFDNNIYIFLANLDDGCILNVEENKCEDFKYTSLKEFESGLYYFDEEKIHVLNVLKNETKEYKNYTKDKYLTTSQLNNNLLYYFTNDYLKIYDLEEGKVSLFDYRINEFIDSLYLKNNLLYLISSKKVYVVNLDDIETKKMNVDDLESLLEKRLTDRIDKIKSDYNVEVKIREEANLNFDVFNESTVGEDIYDNINDSLDSIEEVLNIFGNDFLKEFVHDKYTGLRIYLVGKVNAEFSMNGQQLKYNDKYAIITTSHDIKRTLYHELMHTLEDAVKTKNKTIFSDWKKYNPKGFKYTVDYKEFDSAYKYTVDYKEGDIYFIDNYSQVNELEDRARIFENICMNTATDIKNNPFLLKKAEYQMEEIYKYYPMLKGLPIFDSLK